MELDERPSEEYSDIGGLDKQIEEVRCMLVSHTLSDKLSSACRGNCPAHDSQRKVQEHWHSTTQRSSHYCVPWLIHHSISHRCSVVWCPRHRQDSTSKGLCSTDKGEVAVYIRSEAFTF